MLRVVEFDDGARLIVETEDRESDIPAAVVKMLEVADATKALPDGAEAVSAARSMHKAAVLLENQIAGLGALARAAVTSARPSELEIEAHVQFTCDVEPIPFLVSTRGEGGLKLTLKWVWEKPSPKTTGAGNGENDKSA